MRTYSITATFAKIQVPDWSQHNTTQAPAFEQGRVREAMSRMALATGKSQTRHFDGHELRTTKKNEPRVTSTAVALAKNASHAKNAMDPSYLAKALG